MIAENDASVRRHKTDSPDGAISAETEIQTELQSPDGNRKGSFPSETAIQQSFVSTTLNKLYRAYQFAKDCDRSKWDFAVELYVLTNHGVALEELRWMMGKGLIDHAREIDSGTGVGRGFDTSGGFAITERSCFVITDKGMRVVEGSEPDWHDFAVTQPESLTTVQLPNEHEPFPIWDDQRHELRVGKVVVKRFKWRATNQEAILSAFQEDGWPARIDDPLPPAPDTDPKRRLSDAIKCLNRKQKNSLLRFSGDGTGEGVLWEFVTNGVSEVRF